MIYLRKNRVQRPQAEGAIIVFTIEAEAYFQPPPETSVFVRPRVDPPLKKSQPTQRISVPSAT